MIKNTTQPPNNSFPDSLASTFLQDLHSLNALIDRVHAMAIDIRPRTIRRQRVQELAGNICRAQVYAMLDPKSSSFDKTFPRPFQLGRSANSPVVWWESEVINWLHTKALNRKSIAGLDS